MRLFRVGRVWHFRYQVDGRRVQRSTRETVKYKAEAVARRFFGEAVLWARGDSPVPTLREAVQQWLVVHREVVSGHHWRAMERFERLFLYDLADCFLDELSTEAVERARLLYLQGRARASANHWLNLLRAVCNWAVRRRMLPALPWHVKALKVQKKPRVTLPPSVAWQWLAAVDALGKAGVSLGLRLMFGLGLRESETLTARWEWLDWDRHTYTPGLTKGREADPIPVPAWLMDYLEARGQLTGLMVVRGGLPYASGYARQAMRLANQQLGIERLTPHRLRGTFATLLSEEGVPIQTIQRVMRHKDPMTTMRYLEVNLGAAERGVMAIERRLNQFDEPQKSKLSGEKVANTASQTRMNPEMSDYSDSSARGKG